jgi:hypothetical protein
MIEIEAEVIAETDMAILINDGMGEIWLPKSQLDDWPEVYSTGEIVMPEWLAKEKDLC